MKDPDEWHEIIQNQLEAISHYLRELTPPKFHLGPDEPTLVEESEAMGQKLFSIYHKMEKAMHSLLKILKDPTVLETLGERPELPQAIAEMATIASVIMRQMQPSLQLMAQGKTLQEILGLSDDCLRSFYALSRYLYEQQQYEEACGAFYLLSLINPAYTIFWIGLGNCEYVLKRYQAAVTAYTFALQTDPSDPKTHLLIARCHIGLGNNAAATASLSIAELGCTDRKTIHIIAQLAEQIRKELRGESV